jgi:hypothetical protein
MYAAKTAGKQRYAYYRPEMTALGACRTIKLVACFFEVIPSGVTESTFKTIAERVSGETILLCCRSTSATEISVGFAAYPAANTCILFKL